MDAAKVALARELLSNPERTVVEVCEILGVGKTTLYRALGEGGTRPPGIGAVRQTPSRSDEGLVQDSAERSQ